MELSKPQLMALEGQIRSSKFWVDKYLASVAKSKDQDAGFDERVQVPVHFVAETRNACLAIGKLCGMYDGMLASGVTSEEMPVHIRETVEFCGLVWEGM